MQAFTFLNDKDVLLGTKKANESSAINNELLLKVRDGQLSKTIFTDKVKRLIQLDFLIKEVL